MKLVFFDDFKLGVVKDGNVVDVGAAVSGIVHTSPQDLINQVIANFSQHRSALQVAADNGQGKPVDQVRLRSPLPKPGTIVCMAVNYMEDGTRDEPAPINAFHKSPTAVIGNGDTMVLPDVPATIFEGEAEFALVIGKRAENVRPENAYDHIFGYMGFIDGSARGLFPPGNTFYQMKSRDTFAPMGPWLVTADEINDPRYLANDGRRCFFCKTELYSRLTAMIPELKVHVLANGSNVDDQGDWRPGMTAADEHQVRSPLLEAEIDKQQVRLLAKHWDLTIWDKPATPCLSSRIAYGESVTPERVLMIDRAERFLKEQGLTELRVRYHPGDIARIEVPIEDLERLTDPAWRVPLLSYFRTLGFRHITLDLQGFRSGSMNIGTVANTACQSTDMKSSVIFADSVEVS